MNDPAPVEAPAAPADAAPGTAPWTLVCPRCHGPLEAQRCAACDTTHPCQDGIWRLLVPDDADRVERFLADYTTVRRAEGRGSPNAGYYQALPFPSAADPLAWQWAMRARTWVRFRQRVEARWAPGRRVVDVGAGVGWLSQRLADAGHHPLAVDLSVDPLDGLAAARHYQPTWPRVQASFDRLPLPPDSADAVVFNASLHYSTDYLVTLTEVLRVLAPGGSVVVLDSPVYRHEASGPQMVAERHADFERRFGTRSDSVASVEYLTTTMIADLGRRLGLRWRIHRTWYGWSWALRPHQAKLRRRREPSRFLILVGQREFR